MKNVLSKKSVGSILIISVALVNFALISCTTDRGQITTGADIIFHNAKIITMDEDNPSADTLALSGDKIIAVGSYKKLEHLISPNTKVYDLEGRTIIPGINETHLHVRDLGFQQYYAVNLEPARNIPVRKVEYREKRCLTCVKYCVK